MQNIDEDDGAEQDSRFKYFAKVPIYSFQYPNIRRSIFATRLRSFSLANSAQVLCIINSKILSSATQTNKRRELTALENAVGYVIIMVMVVEG